MSEERERYTFEQMPALNGVFDYRVVDQESPQLRWFPVSCRSEAEKVCNALNVSNDPKPLDVLVYANKTLSDEITALESTIAEQGAEIARLKAEVRSLVAPIIGNAQSLMRQVEPLPTVPPTQESDTRVMKQSTT